MGSWNLGRYFGIHVYLHWTFWILFGVVCFNGYVSGGPTTMLYLAALFASTFLCVTLHEFGHALMARRFGIQTRDVTLYPIGGVARLERMSERPWEEFLIAIAGPAVNVVIALGLVGMIVPILIYTGQEALKAPFPVSFLRDLAATNIILVVFNMIPAFPMDGGRVLRALLVPVIGRLAATRWAAALGALFACSFVVAAFALEAYMLILGAIFVYFAGQQELAFVRFREHQRTAPPLDALGVHEEVLDALPVDFDGGFSGLRWNPETNVWVLWREGKPVFTYQGVKRV